MTKQRAAILAELRALTSHPTACEIYALVRRKLPRISLGTVYRNLDTLAESNEILKLEYAGFQKRFDGNTGAHQHVRCLRCGKVADVDPEMEAPAVPDKLRVAGFTVQFARVEFFGFCAECRGNRL
ncbi:MAG: transcriptional repressor [Deltaproteobacteria bacterium]|jgi:Fur family ferric uptake transcriptional regulator|nr:transcriptional repressor [Deltaproteobacteria bacterium]